MRQPFLNPFRSLPDFGFRPRHESRFALELTSRTPGKTSPERTVKCSRLRFPPGAGARSEMSWQAGFVRSDANRDSKRHAFRKFAHDTNSARQQAAEANLASAATRASAGKPRAAGQFRRRSRTCACCLQIPEPRFPAAPPPQRGCRAGGPGSSGSRSSLFSGRF